MRERIEAALARWAVRIYHRAWLTIAAAAVVVAGLGAALPDLEIDTSTESFLHEDDPVRETYDAFRHIFGRDEVVMVAVEGAVFEPAFLEKLRALHEDLENEVPKLQDVTSLINARDTRGEGDELIVEDLFEDWPETPEELAAIRARALANPLYVDQLLGADAGITTILIETDAYSSAGAETAELGGFDEAEPAAQADAEPPRFLTGEENTRIVHAVQEIVERHDAPDFRIHLAGSPVMMDYLQGAMQRDMVRSTGLALLVIAILLAALFRRTAGVVLPLTVAGLSLACTLGLMVWVGVPVTLPSQILPPFLLAVGVGGSVHVLVMYFQARRRGDDEEASVAFAMGHSGLAIIMTSLTTAGGLVSFATAELAPVAEFGIAAPVGVLIALLFTVVLLPALIAVFPMGGDAPENMRDAVTRRVLVGAGVFATRHAWAIVLASAGLIAIAGLGVAQLRFSHDPLSWFPVGDPFRSASELLNERLKGTMFLEVLVDSGADNGLHEPELLQRMDEMRRTALAYQREDLYVGKVVSLVDVLKEIHQALNENDPAFHTIPSSRTLVAQELLLFENSGADDLEDVVDTRFRLGRFTLKLPFVDAIQYGPYLDRLEERFRKVIGSEAEITLTGLMAVTARTFRAVIYSMAKAYVVAFAVITPLMILLIGSLRTGLLSMVPNLAPILVTLGLMGWLGLRLDAFTLLIGSIAIGLAVDDTIHFMHNFRRYHTRSGDVDDAVRQTLTTTGQALLFTSLVLSTGFFVFALSSLRVLVLFGLLTGFTIIIAFLADVLLAPALVALVFGRERATSTPAPATEGIS